jgi:N-acetylglucosamine kinase-like BadF-type ATPase
MTLLAGVDAGASHTTFILADGALAPLARHSGGPGALKPNQIDLVATLIADLGRAALNDARQQGPVDALVVGAAGAGRDASRVALETALSSTGIARRIQVTTDGHIALESAFGNDPGIVLSAGTGSIGLARTPDGAFRRTGGHGWQVGDEGSGYAVARAALGAAARAVDGRGPSTVLVESLPARVDRPDLPATLEWARTADVAAVAGLASAVLEASEHGDAVARGIVAAAAKDLAAHVHALLAHFPAGRGAPVALSGGLLVESPLMRRALLGALEPDSGRIVVTSVGVDPASGAVALAGKLLG